MLLTFITATSTIIDRQDIAGIYAETSNGPMLLLDHHASLVTTVPVGHVRIIGANDSATFLLRGAVIEINNPKNEATIRALTGEEQSETANLNLSNYLAQLEAILSQPDIDPASFRYRFLKDEKIVIERQIKSRPLDNRSRK